MINQEVTVDFLGTRGAFPLNLPQTQKLGTETSCVVLSCNEDRLILDAGTGLNRISPTENDDIILLSHFHYDHVLGLPYFLSKKRKGCVTLATGCAINSDDFSQKLLYVFGGIGFPVSLGHIFSPINLVVGLETAPMTLDSWSVASIALNHPGGAAGYSVTHKCSSKRICYLMDHEHSPYYNVKSLIEFSKNSDLVIYDAAYSDKNYEAHRGHGHSTIEEGQHFRKMANSKRIVLTGHSIERFDSEIPTIIDSLDSSAETLAYDGLEIVL